MDGLQKQVVNPPALEDNPQLAGMKKKIDAMQWLYVILFTTSLVVLVLNWQGGMPSWMHILWAVSLGGAVITRITRQSLVNKYNALLLGSGPAPLS